MNALEELEERLRARANLDCCRPDVRGSVKPPRAAVEKPRAESKEVGKW